MPNNFMNFRFVSNPSAQKQYKYIVLKKMSLLLEHMQFEKLIMQHDFLVGY